MFSRLLVKESGAQHYPVAHKRKCTEISQSPLLLVVTSVALRLTDILLYCRALTKLLQAAEQGNQEARFNLGALYMQGYGVDSDYAKAIYYFTLAANRGHMLALYNLAMMHLNGFGTGRWVHLAYPLSQPSNDALKDICAER